MPERRINGYRQKPASSQLVPDGQPASDDEQLGAHQPASGVPTQTRFAAQGVVSLQFGGSQHTPMFELVVSATQL